MLSFGSEETPRALDPPSSDYFEPSHILARPATTSATRTHERFGSPRIVSVMDDGPDIQRRHDADQFERALARLKGQQYAPRTDGRLACGLTPDENVEFIEELMCLDQRVPGAFEAWERKWDEHRVDPTLTTDAREYFYVAPTSQRSAIRAHGVASQPEGFLLYFGEPQPQPTIDVWAVDGELLSVHCENALAEEAAVCFNPLDPNRLRLVIRL
jgi:hypothetical protein